MAKSSYRLSLFHLHHKIEKKQTLVITTLTIMSRGIKIIGLVNICQNALNLNHKKKLLLHIKCHENIS